jgi:uncharacterized protein (DUF4415 family)
MKRKIQYPSPEDDTRIAVAIEDDPDAAPDLSMPVPGIVRRVGRPKLARPKEVVNIRLDADLLAYFRSAGPGWQSRMNEALRKAAGL